MKESFMNKTEPRVQGQRGWHLYKRLLKYLTPHKGAFIISVIGYTIFSATGIAVAEWLGWTVDVIESEDYGDLRLLIPLVSVIIVLVRGVGGVMGSYSIAHVSNHVVHKLRCQMLQHLLDLPVAYYDHSTAGRLVSKVTYDVAQITGAFTSDMRVFTYSDIVSP